MKMEKKINLIIFFFSCCMQCQLACMYVCTNVVSAQYLFINSAVKAESKKLNLMQQEEN